MTNIKKCKIIYLDNNVLITEEQIEKFEEKHITDWSTIKSVLREELRDYIYKKTRYYYLVIFNLVAREGIEPPTYRV